MADTKYEVLCSGCNYHSWPMYEGIAKNAKLMHEMLGKKHVCKLIPVK